MALSHRNGVALSGISAINGVSKASLAAINGQTLGGGGGAGVIGTDTFDNGGGSAIALSGNWTTMQGSFSVIPGGTVHGATAATTQLARYSAGTFAADQYSQVVVFNPVSSSYFGVSVRDQTGAVTAYYCVIDGAGGYVELGRTVAGSDTVLTTFTQTFAVNDVLRLEVSGTGATVTLTVKRAAAATPTSFSTVGSFNDTTGSRITTAGQAGLAGYDTSTSGTGATSWEGGNL